MATRLKRLCEVRISTNEQAYIMFVNSEYQSINMLASSHIIEDGLFRGTRRRHGKKSLQILVYLEAMVAGVRDHHVTVARDRETLRAVQRVGRGANVG